MKKDKKLFVNVDYQEKGSIKEDARKQGLSVSGFFRYLWYQWRQNKKGG